MTLYHRFRKWAAGKAFQWGLKILTEEYGASATVPKARKPRTRKSYVQ